MPGFEATPVILMSAVARLSLAYRVVAFFPKPFDLRQLLSTISHSIRKP